MVSRRQHLEIRERHGVLLPHEEAELSKIRAVEQAAREIIAKAYATQPHLQLAIGRSNRNNEVTSIGAWDAKQGRYVTVAGHLITGEWVSMPYELLINGELPVIKWECIARA